MMIRLNNTISNVTAEDLANYDSIASHGACRGTSLLAKFYPDDRTASQSHNEVKQLCDSCSVKQQCHDWAVKHERHGYWAGLSVNERRRQRATAYQKRLGEERDAK